MFELLRGERELNEIAAENEIAPNQLRNRKAEYLDNAESAFDRKRDRRLHDKPEAKQKEADELAKKEGQQTIAIDFLKNVRNEVSLSRRTELLSALHVDSTKTLQVSTAAELLSVNRTSVYYKPSDVSDGEIATKNLIDMLHTDHPA